MPPCVSPARLPTKPDCAIAAYFLQIELLLNHTDMFQVALANVGKGYLKFPFRRVGTIMPTYRVAAEPIRFRCLRQVWQAT